MNDDILTFHSSGKLLLSGEYFVLDGAKAIGLPSKFGQRLAIQKMDSNIILWESYTKEETKWFDAKFSIEDFEILESSDQSIAETLQNILQKSRLLNPNFCVEEGGFTGRTYLEFPRLWGLGSSSTLINNIAQWAAIDPFELSNLTLGGSGYDIACASAQQAIYYQRTQSSPLVEPIHFLPSFRNQLYFIYLDRKQNSRDAIKHYRSLTQDKLAMIERISSLSEALLEASDLSTFQEIIKEHEALVSEAIKMPTVQESIFPDFGGVVKSLGAWGGDFVLAASAQERSAIKNYFNKKGFQTFLDYEEMIK